MGILLALQLLCAGTAACEPARVTVNPNSCTAVSQQQKLWLPAEWTPLYRYVRACPIEQVGTKPAILLVSVFAADYYKDQPGDGVPQVKMPRPILFSPTGKVLGRLPYNFPDDPPTELQVTFSDWQAGFPARVELFLKDPAAGGDRRLRPLVWDRQRAEFQPEPKQEKK
jgi:hypothetical protein